MNSNKIEKFK